MRDVQGQLRPGGMPALGRLATAISPLTIRSKTRRPLGPPRRTDRSSGNRSCPAVEELSVEPAHLGVVHDSDADDGPRDGEAPADGRPTRQLRRACGALVKCFLIWTVIIAGTYALTTWESPTSADAPRRHRHVGRRGISDAAVIVGRQRLGHAGLDPAEFAQRQVAFIELAVLQPPHRDVVHDRLDLGQRHFRAASARPLRPRRPA